MICMSYSLKTCEVTWGKTNLPDKRLLVRNSGIPGNFRGTPFSGVPPTLPFFYSGLKWLSAGFEIKYVECTKNQSVENIPDLNTKRLFREYFLKIQTGMRIKGSMRSIKQELRVWWKREKAKEAGEIRNRTFEELSLWRNKERDKAEDIINRIIMWIQRGKSTLHVNWSKGSRNVRFFEYF